MQSFKNIPFFLFLLVLFFCLHGSVENYGYLNVKEVVQVAAIALLCMAVFFGLAWLITKKYRFVSLVTFFISLWYLFFGAIHDFIKTTSLLQFLQSFTVLLPLLIVFNVAVVWWLKRSSALYQRLFLYLNVLFLLFCIADAFLLVNRYANYDETTLTDPVPFDKTKVSEKPNVYYLLLDEYAGYKSLSDSFNFKNDSFYRFLQQRNFNELPTFANYDFTPFSMSSIMNMQYVPENYNKKLLTQPDMQRRFGEIRNGQVFSIFKSLNYSIENYSIFDIKDYPALFESNGLFPIHAGLLTNKVFHNRLMKGIGWWLLTGRFEIPFLKKYYMYRKDAYNKEVEEMVYRSPVKKTVRPKFCYAHFLLPHGQFYRDSSGAFNTPQQILDMNSLADKSQYLSYLKYTNNIIENLVDQMVSNDPQSIIIIMSDHGFYDYEGHGDFDPYNFDNICFVRFPGNKQYQQGLPKSNVNFFRYLFNCSFGQKLPYLKDSSLFIIEDPVILR